MLSARSMFQAPKFSVSFIQDLIDKTKELLIGNKELAEKANNVFKTVTDANQQLEAHTPTITDESTKPTSTQSTDKVVPYGHKGTNILGKLLGPVGLMLLNALSAEAIPAGLIIQSGHAGGTDLCKGLYWCIQATINNATSNEVLAQASRDISLTGAGGSYITELALSTEFTDETLVNVLTSALNAAPDWYTNRSTACTENAGLWMGTQFTGSATHLTQDACDQFKEFFSKSANAAGNARTSAKVFGISLGITVAILLAIIACCVVSCCLCPELTSDVISTLAK